MFNENDPVYFNELENACLYRETVKMQNEINNKTTKNSNSEQIHDNKAMNCRYQSL